jgi:hypothetical protein
MFLYYTNMNDPRHAELNKELEKDIGDYTKGQQRAGVVSPKLADSVERWPLATEEILVYRGQPKTFKKLPIFTREVPFFSSTDRLDIATRFAKYASDGGQVFVIKIQPGVRFLVVSGSPESEILVEGNGIAEYGTSKVRVQNSITWTMATPITYKPKSTGGRPKTRRRTRSRRSSKVGRNGRYTTRHLNL